MILRDRFFEKGEKSFFSCLRKLKTQFFQVYKNLFLQGIKKLTAWVTVLPEVELHSKIKI